MRIRRQHGRSRRGQRLDTGRHRAWSANADSPAKSAERHARAPVTGCLNVSLMCWLSCSSRGGVRRSTLLHDPRRVEPRPTIRHAAQRSAVGRGAIADATDVGIERDDPGTVAREDVGVRILHVFDDGLPERNASLGIDRCLRLDDQGVTLFGAEPCEVERDSLGDRPTQQILAQVRRVDASELPPRGGLVLPRSPRSRRVNPGLSR